MNQKLKSNPNKILTFCNSIVSNENASFLKKKADDLQCLNKDLT